MQAFKTGRLLLFKKKIDNTLFISPDFGHSCGGQKIEIVIFLFKKLNF